MEATEITLKDLEKLKTDLLSELETLLSERQAQQTHRVSSKYYD